MTPHETGSVLLCQNRIDNSLGIHSTFNDRPAYTCTAIASTNTAEAHVPEITILYVAVFPSLKFAFAFEFGAMYS